jgi:hypothetical protein
MPPLSSVSRSLAVVAATAVLALMGTLGARSARADTSAPCADLSATPAADGAGSAEQATFRLCGSSDPATERAIEQLIAGRSFSVTLTARGDGCADLIVQPSAQAQAGLVSGSQTSNLSVSSGGRSISVQIATQNGVTRASIGA